MIRNVINRKDQISNNTDNYAATISRVNTGAEFTFIRTDTGVATHPHYAHPHNGFLSPTSADPTFSSLSPHGRSRSNSNSSSSTRRRLSHRLHLSRDSGLSDNVPANLPVINSSQPGAETEWEKRATMLAMGGSSRPDSPGAPPSPIAVHGHVKQWAPPQSNKELDADIQEAIRLHEEGDLTNSTRIFAKLANPAAANNPLSQVLYGLALRHGWGVAKDEKLAVHNLSLAAVNAAGIEQRALEEGKLQGGPAKGELVLAIYELANCFRNEWGVEKDPVAAKQYYETAANLGDTDAMNEVAACYLNGFGCRKDKMAAAKYYRLAETNGNKTIGNSWIWKDKYDPDKQGKKRGLFSRHNESD